MRELSSCVSDIMGEIISGLTSPLVVGQTQQLLWPVENLDFPQQVRKSRYLMRNNLFLHVDIIRDNVRLWESALTIATRVRCNGEYTERVLQRGSSGK